MDLSWAVLRGDLGDESILRLKCAPPRESPFQFIGERELPREIADVVDEKSDGRFVWCLFSDDFIFVFTMIGVFVWNIKTNVVGPAIDMGLIEHGRARVVEIGVDWLIIGARDGLGFVIARIGQDSAEVSVREVGDVKCFDVIEGNVVAVGKDTSILMFNVNSDVIDKRAFPVVARWNPFRSVAIGDAHVLALRGDFIVTAIPGSFAVFEVLVLRGSVVTCEGNPIAIDVCGDYAFVVIANNRKCAVARVRGVFSGNLELAGIADVGENVYPKVHGFVGGCCCYDGTTIYVSLFERVNRTFAIHGAEVRRDWALGCAVSGNDIRIMSSESGELRLQLLSVEEIWGLIDVQLLGLLNAFQMWNDGHCEAAKRDIEALCISDKAIAEFDLRVSTFSGDVCLQVIQERLKAHDVFMEMVNTVTGEVLEDLELNGYTLAILAAAADLPSWQSLRELQTGDAVGIVARARTGCENGDIACLTLLTVIANACASHYNERDDVYRTALRSPPDVIKAVRSTLAGFPLNAESAEQYAGLCVAYSSLASEQNEVVSYTLRLLSVSPDHCENAAIAVRMCSVLGEILHVTGEFGRGDMYIEVLGREVASPILKSMIDNGYIEDVVVMGSKSNWRDTVAEVMSYDSLILAVHHITMDDRDLVRAAGLIMDALKTNSYTLEQTLNLCALAKICCKATGRNKGLCTQVSARFNVLRVQMKSRIGGDCVFPSVCLIDELVARKDIATGLCVYALSISERSEEENGSVLASILAPFARNIAGHATDPDVLPLVSLLIESRAVSNVPSALQGHLEQLVSNGSLVRSIMSKVSEAQRTLSTATGEL